MVLNFPPEWDYEGFEASIPPLAITEFHDLLCKIARKSTERQKWILERFKSHFGVSFGSTNTGFAEADLRDAMGKQADNAATFVDALWSGIEGVSSEVATPSPGVINKILAAHGVGLAIDPPDLVLTTGDYIANPSGGKLDSPAAPMYTIGEEIGRGGFGVVHKVSRLTSVGELEFAMKILDPSAFNSRVEKAPKRFTREMKAISRLQHRGIVPFVDAGIGPDGKPFIVMPLIAGTDLRQSLSGRDFETTVEMFCEILETLEYAHSQGVYHRDLKPSNVIVRESDNQAIIVDFGCAYILDSIDSEALTTAHIGSVNYMPVEVIRDPTQRNPLHDVYSVGVMLYEIVTGSLPLSDDYEPMSDIREEFEILDPVVRDALAPSSMRIKSAGGFRGRLEAILNA